MAFRLERPEGPAQGLRRVVVEQVDRSIHALRDAAPETRDECIHDVRKRCKRVRATVRLAREDLGDKAYRRENACFRDVARVLAPARDAFVLVQTLDRVVDHFDDQLTTDAFAPVRKVLDERARSVVGDDEGDVVEPVCDALADARERVPGWPLTAAAWDALAPGFGRTYGRARDGMLAALDSAEDAVFHEWRKQVKYLWHQVQLVAPAWPEVLDVLAGEVHRLADDLGNAHDLALLHAALAADADLGGDPVALDALAGLVERRRRHFQEASVVRGRRLFAETPGAFTDRVGAYWNAWHAG